MVEMGTDRMHHGFFPGRTWIPVTGGTFPRAPRERHPRLPPPRGRARRRTSRPCRRGDGRARSSPTTAPGDGRRNPSQRVATARGTAGDAPRALTRTTPTEVGIDWSKTVAWGEGGYYARVFLNVEGREPEGIIREAEYESVRNDLAERLGAIPDENGDPLDTEGLQAGRDLRGGKRRRPRPHRPLRRPRMARCRDDRRRRGHPHVRERHGARRREPRPGRPSDHGRARNSGRLPGGMHLLDVAPTALDLLGLDTGHDEGSKPRRGRRRASNRDSERGRRIVNPHAAPYVRFWWLVVIGVVVACLAGTAVVYHIEPGMPPKLTERTPPSYSATAILMLTSKEQPLVRIGVTTVTPRGPSGAPWTARRRDVASGP